MFIIYGHKCSNITLLLRVPQPTILAVNNQPQSQKSLGTSAGGMGTLGCLGAWVGWGVWMMIRQTARLISVGVYTSSRYQCFLALMKPTCCIPLSALANPQIVHSEDIRRDCVIVNEIDADTAISSRKDVWGDERACCSKTKRGSERICN